jgi:ferredoxin-NADP reductase
MPVEVLLKLIEKKELTPSVFSLHFTSSEEISFLPGQFLSFFVPKPEPGRNWRRSYSIASPPENKILDFCIKRVEKGPGTLYLDNLKVGDTCRSIGPYGQFYYESGKKNVFIATGTGLAPMRSMVLSEAFKKESPEALVLLGVTESSEILYQNDFAHCDFVSCLSREKKQDHFSGRVTDFLRQTSKIDWAQSHFYLCGNGAMISEVKSILFEKKVEKNYIHHEAYF